MSLLPGKENIGTNISELEHSDPNRPHAQNVAIALHKAYGKNDHMHKRAHTHEDGKHKHNRTTDY